MIRQHFLAGLPDSTSMHESLLQIVRNQTAPKSSENQAKSLRQQCCNVSSTNVNGEDRKYNKDTDVCVSNPKLSCNVRYQRLKDFDQFTWCTELKTELGFCQYSIKDMKVALTLILLWCWSL